MIRGEESISGLCRRPKAQTGKQLSPKCRLPWIDSTPHALCLEGRCGCRGDAAGNALYCHLRHGGARHSRRLLVRIGLRTGFRRYELPALGGALVLIAVYFTGTPTGPGATLIVSGLILGRAGSWWRREPAPAVVAAGV
jgi:hypothetical protein